MTNDLFEDADMGQVLICLTSLKNAVMRDGRIAFK